MTQKPEVNKKPQNDQEAEYGGQHGKATGCEKLEIGKRKKRKTSVEKSIEMVMEQFKTVTKDEFERYHWFRIIY